MSAFAEKSQLLRDCAERHYNCAQAVVIPFAENAGINAETAIKFAAGFGGGMRRGSVCGAVTGGLMALGLYEIDDPPTIGEYHRRLKDNHDDILDCGELLRVNAGSGLPKKPYCDALVRECAALVEEILKEKQKL
ncbi:MAG: C_GCAxxG_C_C family protein [Lachnospiraceae bacterium]|nr:C_GCAxxG_C_C family protein [Lachnospiraceae bacterium]